MDGEDLHGAGSTSSGTPNPHGHEPKALRGERLRPRRPRHLGRRRSGHLQELIEDENNPKFGDMINNSHTVMTQAFQLWMTQDGA